MAVSHPFIVKRKFSKYSVVLIGSGWWGMNILREAIRSGEVTVAALCDVDERQIKKCEEEVRQLCSDRPKHYKDYRECLQKEKPDIAIIATPDHWHALTAIEAMKNGAHIFLEKPVSHTVKEGTAIQQTARDTQRICIVDFHRRYSPHNVSGMEFLQSGKAGKIEEVQAFVNYRWGMGSLNEQEEIPAGLDWDFYCGPSDPVPYSSRIHPRSWRQYSHFANGQIGDWGPHWFDQILWWTEEKLPGKFSLRPDTLVIQAGICLTIKWLCMNSRVSPAHGNIRCSTSAPISPAKMSGSFFTAQKALFTWVGNRAGRFTLPIPKKKLSARLPNSTSLISKTSNSYGRILCVPFNQANFHLQTSNKAGKQPTWLY